MSEPYCGTLKEMAPLFEHTRSNWKAAANRRKLQPRFPGSRAWAARPASLLILLLISALPCPAMLRAGEPAPGADQPAQQDAAAATSNDPEARQQLEFFENHIRPMLAKHCYACHSADAAKEGKLRGGLMLDSREAARAGGDSGPAVVPGNPDDSLLVSALRHESFEMPPKGKLPDKVIGDFVKWIEAGAVDPREGRAARPSSGIDIAAGREFWSFQPLTAVEPPADDSGWSFTPIDRFIAARQKAAGLVPNLEASARILVRRAWFDLLGLPPSPEEMDEWVGRLTEAAESAETGDTQPRINREAWARLIDHLLESPHYGERWARHWMDVARFAESHGYEQDYDRPNAYHYRDFLIRAFNDDLPYDRFVRWQLAGDELAPDEPLAWMATGFLGAGAFPTQLTEAEFESARYDELDDMVATTGVAFLGLSTGCARCHDHKFDPIPAADYYRLAASFTTAIRSEREFDLQPEENERRRREYQRQLEARQAALRKFEREALPDRFRQWLKDYDPVGGGPSAWRVLRGEVNSTGGGRFVAQDDGSYLAQGTAPDKETIHFRVEGPLRDVASVRLEALADESLPRKGPGRAANGNFALGDFRLEVLPREPDSNAGSAAATGEQVARPIPLKQAKATHQQNSGSLSVAASIDDDPISGWAVDGQIGKDQAAVFVPERPFQVEAGESLRVTLVFQHPNSRHAIGRFRLSVSSQAGAEPRVGTEGPDAKVLEALAQVKQDPDPQSQAWQTAIAWFRPSVPEWVELEQAVARLEEQGPGVELTKVMVVSEGLPHLPHHADGRGFPHFYEQTYQLLRGDVHQKQEVAEPGFLQVLMRDGYDASHWRAESPREDTRTSYRRASLADWITDVEYGAGHLAARVIVNRLWQHHFGRGIVATPNDFGASGERPTHPELLDWLAADLIAGGWRLKRMHRQIMTSHVYMQSTEWDQQRAEIDRENMLLWRREPRRLEAEAIRDTMLAVSGQLDTTMYGPGTLDPNMRRRSVYFFIKRSRLIPMMMLFDWPEHLVSIGQRASTTIAPQALMFMNSPQGRVYAEAFARRIDAEMPDAGKGDEAVQRAYRRAFGRSPSKQERSLATEFLARQAELHRQAGHGEPDRLALTDLCQTLMSMNEFIYVE